MNLFDIWNEQKKITDSKYCRHKFGEGEIWWIQFGKNIGTEMFGKGVDFLRPGIVLRKVYDDAALIVPLSTNSKSGDYYFNFNDMSNKSQTALMHQIRYVDTRRFRYRMQRMSESDFKKIKTAFIKFIKNNPRSERGATIGKSKGVNL